MAVPTTPRDVVMTPRSPEWHSSITRTPPWTPLIAVPDVAPRSPEWHSGPPPTPPIIALPDVAPRSPEWHSGPPPTPPIIALPDVATPDVAVPTTPPTIFATPEVLTAPPSPEALSIEARQALLRSLPKELD